jgi:hypothetical protein
MMHWCNRKNLFVVVVATLPLVWAGAALAAPVTVNFDSAQDSLLVGSNLPDPFESADSNLLLFSHTTDPFGLFMQNSPDLTVDTNGLFVAGDFNDGGLLIDVVGTADEISLWFGNDIQLLSSTGAQILYEVELTTFLGGLQVGQTSFMPNYDGVTNEMISFTGAVFDSAILKFDVDPQYGLAEAVDSVFVNVVPEPGASVLFGAGALLVATALRRRAACG